MEACAEAKCAVEVCGDWRDGSRPGRGGELRLVGRHSDVVSEVCSGSHCGVSCDSWGGIRCDGRTARWSLLSVLTILAP